MYNPNASTLPTTSSVATSYFTLEDTITKSVVELLIQPSEQSYTFSADYAKIPVLGRAQPFLSYKSSEVTFSIPDVKFWTYGNNKDLTAHLKSLSDFTVPTADILEPPLLKLTMGATVYDRIRLSKFTYKVTQTRGGLPIAAEGSMDFLLDPIPPEPTIQEVSTTLSEPEKVSAAAQVTKLLEGSKDLAAKFDFTKGSSVVTVSDNGDVSIATGGNAGATVVGKLGDILGTATPAALNSADLKTAQPAPAPKAKAVASK